MTTPILLIHGLFGSLSDPRIATAFGERPVLAPDLLGYGAYRSADTSGMSLEAQADHVAAWVQQRGAGPVHVVGHSVGGAIAMFFASRHPGLARSLTSIEGNFTLNDAFWSSRIAQMALPEVEAIVAGYQGDVAGWIAGSGVAPSPWVLDVAQRWLHNQPASTVQAQARAVVAATARADYLGMVQGLLDSGLPLHLIAGARSRAGWDVPAWAARQAASHAEIAETGHLMMLEAPEHFAAAILSNCKA
jgi:pimeloyl-ACP methyl ester carboxylesterase